MKAAISKLSRVAQDADNLRSLRELSFADADITDVEPSALRWDRITLNRTNDRWRELLSLAKLLLGDRHQTTNAGADDGHALLFEMIVHFKQHIAKLLKRGLAGTPFRVTSQGGQRNCLFEAKQGRFITRLDIPIRHKDDVFMVINTKWKRISPRSENAI